VARATARVDLVVWPWPVGRTVGESQERALLEAGRAEGVLQGEGQVGEGTSRWVTGGFGAWRVDRFPSDRMISSQQGGFRVQCASCRAPLAAAYASAVSAWRDAGPREVTCPRCQTTQALESAHVAPPAAFGRWFLHLMDVQAAQLTPAAEALFRQHLGDYRVSPRRP